MCRAKDHPAGLTLCWLLLPASLQGEAVHDLCPEAECSSAPEMNWEAAEVGRDFPFPSGRTGDSNFPPCSQRQTLSGFTAGADCWRGKAQTKSSIQVFAGGERGTASFPLCSSSTVITCCDEKRDPLCCSAEKSKSRTATYQKALLCLLFVFFILSENIFTTPITAVTEEWELKDFFKPLFLHFHTFSEPFYINTGHVAGDKCGRSPARCFLGCQVTHPKSTGQIKVYL